jgi:two-component system cell cycle response regulator
MQEHSMPQAILLIDDSRAIHALVASRLKDERITLLSAYTAAEGLAAARKFAPDLILLDTDLPDAPGVEICRQLKADEQMQGTPVIFLTAAISPDDRVYDPSLGAADFISKPLNPAELKARVRAALRTRELLEQLETGAKIDVESGLWNRAYFDQRFCQELSLSRRAGRPLACILAEIDHFASFSEAHGEEILHLVGAALSDSTRLEDEVCRFGRDQFIVLCPCTDLAGAQSLADRCREAVDSLIFKCDGQVIPITCSFGLAEDDGRKMSIIQSAETSLQCAKTRAFVPRGSLLLPLESAQI